MRLFKQMHMGIPTGRYMLEAVFIANATGHIGGKSLTSTGSSFSTAKTLTELEILIDLFAKAPNWTKAELHRVHGQGFCPTCGWTTNDCDCVRKQQAGDPRPTPVERTIRCECGAHKVKSNIHSDWCPIYVVNLSI